MDAITKGEQNPGAPHEDEDDDREMECPDCGTVSGDDIRRSTGQFDDGTYIETFSCRRCARAVEADDDPEGMVRRETVICERYIRVGGTPMMPTERR